jgi:hypothetical protein
MVKLKVFHKASRLEAGLPDSATAVKVSIEQVSAFLHIVDGQPHALGVEQVHALLNVLLFSTTQDEHALQPSLLSCDST